MNIFDAIKQALKKHPLIIILIGLIMLVLAVFNAFIPLMAMVIGIVNMTGGGFFDSILSLLQMLIDPANIPTILITLVILTFTMSIAVALLLPGFLLLVDDGLKKGVKKRRLFLQGTKNNFFRFFLMTLKTLAVSIVFSIFLMVASVPAIIISRAVMTTKQNLVLAAVFVDLVTVGVFLMCFYFFKAYLFMWYIAAVKGEKRPFKTGRENADSQFWSMTAGLFGFDFVFAAAFYLIYSSDVQLLRYISGWVFATVFFTTLAIYLVRSYNRGALPDKLNK